MTIGTRAPPERPASYCLRGEDVTPVEVVFDRVANSKTNNTTEVAHFLGLEDIVKAKFKAPEDQGSGQAHKSVERESLRVVGDTACLEAKDVALVEDILDDKPNACAEDNGYHDVERAFEAANK